MPHAEAGTQGSTPYAAPLADGVCRSGSSAQTTATVRYSKPTSDPGGLAFHVGDLPAGVTKQTNLETYDADVTVQDLHSVAADEIRLQRNGFQLVKFTVPSDIDWDDAEQVQERYYPLVEQLLKQLTGASKVLMFDNMIRRGHTKTKAQQEGITPRGASVSLVHVDYTVVSGPDRLKADKLRQTPFAVIQVWRPLVGPVQSSPLGMIDWTSLAKEDLMQYSLVFPDRIGHNYAVAQNPDHRWYYASKMNTDEALVFVCYDSRADGRAHFVPHTGIIDHATAAGAPPRESIEARAYCFWEHEPAQQHATEL